MTAVQSTSVGGDPWRESNIAEPSIRVGIENHGPTCRISISGVLSGTSIAALEAQIDQLGCLPCEQVLIDVSHLVAIDSVGANVLLGLRHYIDGRGGRLRIVGASGQVATLLSRHAWFDPTEGIGVTGDG
jgi:anti-anti-sigma factor